MWNWWTFGRTRLMMNRKASENWLARTFVRKWTNLAHSNEFLIDNRFDAYDLQFVILLFRFLSWNEMNECVETGAIKMTSIIQWPASCRSDSKHRSHGPALHHDSWFGKLEASLPPCITIPHTVRVDVVTCGQHVLVSYVKVKTSELNRFANRLLVDRRLIWPVSFPLFFY